MMRLFGPQTVDGAFNELTALLGLLPKEESKSKRAEFRARLNVAKSGDLPTMSDLWKRWEKLPSTQRRTSHIDDVARWGVGSNSYPIKTLMIVA